MVCDINARILFLGKLYVGSEVDFGLFKKELANFNYEQLKIWVDLGFVGIKNVIKNGEVQIGYKNPKCGELTPQQKQVNQAIAKKRIRVEHAIGGLKRYYILRHEVRLKKPHLNQKLDDAILICAQLWNFRRAFTLNKPL